MLSILGLIEIITEELRQMHNTLSADRQTVRLPQEMLLSNQHNCMQRHISLLLNKLI